MVWHGRSYSQAGAPYAYTTYIHLKLNGQFYGLYLFTEDDNNQYLDVRACGKVS